MNTWKMGISFFVTLLIIVLNDHYVNCLIDAYRFAIQPLDDFGTDPFLSQRRVEENTKAWGTMMGVFAATKMIMFRSSDESDLPDNDCPELWRFRNSIEKELIDIRQNAVNFEDPEYNKRTAATLLTVLINQFLAYYYISNGCMTGEKGPRQKGTASHVTNHAKYLLKFAARIPTHEIVNEIINLTRPCFGDLASTTFRNIGRDLDAIHESLENPRNMSTLEHRASADNFLYGSFDKRAADEKLNLLAYAFSNMLFEFVVPNLNDVPVVMKRQGAFTDILNYIAGFEVEKKKDSVINLLVKCEKEVAIKFGFSAETEFKAAPTTLTLGILEKYTDKPGEMAPVIVFIDDQWTSSSKAVEMRELFAE